MGGRQVQRSYLYRTINEFLESDKRLLLIKGLPGCGKTTELLKTAERNQLSFITTLSDVGKFERWSAQLDRDVSFDLEHSFNSFIAFSQNLVLEHEKIVLIIVDELEKVPDPLSTLLQILSDLSDFPDNIKVVAAIRWGDFSTQTEEHVLNRGDILVHTINELRGDELASFLVAYDLPTNLPLKIRNILKTPFAISVFSTSNVDENSSVHLGRIIESFFENQFKSSNAKKLFLEAVGFAAITQNYPLAIQVTDILAAAKINSIPLTVSDCDSDLHTSSLRFFIDKGILVEDIDGIRATHDLWMEYLVVRTFHSISKEKGLSALIDFLLEVDFGICWSSVLLMPWVFSLDELRCLSEKLIAIIEEYRDGLTKKEQEEEWHAGMYLRNLSLMNFNPDSAKLRHSLEKKRSLNIECPALLRTSRATEVLGMLYTSEPNVVSPLIISLKSTTFSWLINALMPKVVLDPFFVSLIDDTNQPSKELVLRIIAYLAKSSLGVRVEFNGKTSKNYKKIKVFDGPRLPTILSRSLINGLDLIMPCTLEYLPNIFPHLITFFNDKEDYIVIGLLEQLSDYLSVIISSKDDPVASWVNLIEKIQPEFLPAAGWLFSSTYPHVDPKVLIEATRNLFKKDHSFFEFIIEFNFKVISMAMEFILLEVAHLPTERCLFKFVDAVTIWSMELTFSGVAKFLQKHIDKRESRAEKLAIHCIILLTLMARLEATSEPPPVYTEIVGKEIDATMTLLVSILKKEYHGFKPQKDVSRLLLELSEWLHGAGRIDDVSELIRVGNILSHVCDGLFGRPL